MKQRVTRWVTLLALVAMTMVNLPASLGRAATNDVLILDTSVSGGTNSMEAQQVRAMGLNPVVVNGTTWDAMSTADFAGYKAIVLGDPYCSGSSTSSVGAAISDAATWGKAITGNVFIIGSDPTLHYKPTVVYDGIHFAAGDTGKTGAYITLSCYYWGSGSHTPVPLLDAFHPGGFTARGASGCANNAHIVATSPALNGLNDSLLSNWGCSIHEGFDLWPSDFQVLAIVKDGSLNYTASDGSTGTPYIMARGESLTVISNIKLTPATATQVQGTSYTSTATVLENGAPISGTAVHFSVTSGPDAGTTGSANTNPSGQAGFTFTGKGVGTDNISATYVDSLGHTQTSNVASVTWTPADTVPPITTASGSNGYTSGSWTNVPVTVTLSATDNPGGSGVATTYYALDNASCAPTATGACSTYSAPVSVSAPGTHTLTYFSTDKAGNVEAAHTFTVHIDQTVPAITTSRTPAANSFGWNNTPVSVTFNCTTGPAGVLTPPLSPQVVSTDGAGQSLTGTCIDNAGNQASATVSGINYDHTPPTLTGVPTAAPTGTSPDGTSWYSGDVPITWTCSDALSGIDPGTASPGPATSAGCPANNAVMGEGRVLSAVATIADKAGNSTTASSAPVNIDRTAPVTVANVPSGWSNASVPVTLSATDNLSGVKATHYTLDGGAPVDGTSLTVSGDGIHTLTFWSEDYAGNLEGARTVQVKVDTTAPTITHTTAQANGHASPNTAGWNNSAVTVTFSCTDATSGVKTCDGVTNTTGTNNSTASTTIGTEGASQSVTGTAVDNAGNQATDPLLLNIDLTPPSVAGTLSPAGPNGSDGWYTSPVTVTWACTDAVSGAVGCSGPTALSTDGSNLSATGTGTDAAGNTGTGSVSGINIDQTPPTVTGAPTSLPNTNGWYTGDVTIAWTCTDATSGVPSGTCPGNSTITGEGNNQAASVSVPDAAGNVGSGTYSVKIDRTKPVTTASVPRPIYGDFYNGAVPVTLTATDSLSGVASTFYSIDGGATQTYNGTPFNVTGDGKHTVTFWSVDQAGNTEDNMAAGHTVSFEIDTTAPSISGALSPTTPDGNNGWYRSDVTATFTCGDTGSGVATCTPPTVLNKDGANQSVTGTAVDNVGNSATATVNTINIDETPPVITASAATADGNPYLAGTWTNQSVTVTFSCIDATSGVDTVTPPVTLSDQGGNLGTLGTCTDKAGNSSTMGFTNINIDKTPPTIAGAQSPLPNSHGWNNTPVVVSFTCTDPAPASMTQAMTSPAISGVQGCTGGTTVSTEGQNQSVTGTALDKAENSAQATVSNISIDLTPPTLTGTPTTAPNGSNGWYTSPVTIHWTAGDTLSGVDPSTVPADSTMSDNGQGVSTSASVSDLAGNQTTAKSQPVNIDTKPPVTSANAPSSWNTSSVPMTLTASDDTSGVAATYYTIDGGAQQTYGSTFNVTGDGVHTVQFWSVDRAGNIETARTATIKIDTTAPSITHTQSPAVNAQGWNNTDVAVTFTCTDNTSGIASCDGTSYPATGANGTGPTTATGGTTLGTEGKAQAVTGQAIDVAGNSASNTASVSIDKTPPTISGAADRAPDHTAADGTAWYNKPVSVDWTYGDALSGVVTSPNTVKLTSDGAGQSASGTAVDAAGNSSTATVSGINIDQTAPTVAGVPTTPANANGWYNGDVNIHWTCADATSGVPAGTCPVDSTITGEGSGLSAGTQVSDNAGNMGQGNVTGIHIDRTKPTTVAQLPAANANGWYNASVPVTLVAKDNLSGVAATYYTVDGGAAQTYTGPFSVSGDGTHTVTLWSVDRAGNVEDRTGAGNVVSFRIDTTPPTISGSSAPAANSNGWNNTNVVVSFKCDDTLSGIDTCAAPVTLSAEGAGQSATGMAMDKAGNTATATVGNINIDKTAPVVTYGGNAGSYTVDQSVSITCTPSDALSGVASSTCAPVTGPAYSFTVGANSFTASATDRAGNTGTGTTSFKVAATFDTLCALTQHFTTDPNRANSLCSKLTNAQAQATAGNTNAKNNILGAYKNELAAQSGKTFTPAQVVILTRWASSL